VLVDTVRLDIDFLFLLIYADYLFHTPASIIYWKGYGMNRCGQFALFVTLMLVCNFALQAQAPLPPQGLTLNPGAQGGVVLHWDSSAGALGYKVYKAVDHLPFIRIETLLRREFVDWWIFPGFSYAYYVTAVNDAGESDPSDTVLFSLDHPPIPPVHGVITGHVVDDSTGLPLREAVINFFRPSGLWSMRTHTDTVGVYRAALEPGQYLIHAEKPGYIAEWFDNVRRVDSAFVVDLHQDSTITANFGLEPFAPPLPVTVSGTVTDSVTGNPLPNSFVAFLRPYRFLRELEEETGLFGGPPEEQREIPELGRLHGVVWVGRTDSNGNYTAHLFSGLRYIAVAFKPGYIAKFYNNKHNPFDADRLFFTHDTSGIDFQLLPNPVAINMLSGSVVDSTGAGIPSHVILIRKVGLLHFPVRFCMTD
jgi:hypothetical protein